MFWRRKIKVNLIDKNWNRFKNDFPVDAIPRVGDLMVIDNTKTYYRVTHVIHRLNDNYGIFIVIEDLDNYEGRLNNITKKLPKNED